MSQSKLRILFVVVLVFLLVGITYTLFSEQNKEVNQEAVTAPQLGAEETQKTLVSEEPKPPRVDYGNSVPPDFLSSLPIEDGAALTESFGLDYQNQGQSTVSFSSKKTAEQNFDTYRSFFTEEQFSIVNEYKSESLYSLYATNEKVEVNVTIASDERSEGATVTISVLRKKS